MIMSFENPTLLNLCSKTPQINAVSVASLTCRGGTQLPLCCLNCFSQNGKKLKESLFWLLVETSEKTWKLWIFLCWCSFYNHILTQPPWIEYTWAPVFNTKLMWQGGTRRITLMKAIWCSDSYYSDLYSQMTSANGSSSFLHCDYTFCHDWQISWCKVKHWKHIFFINN